MENKENFFEKFGLEVSTGDVEVGQTYPIYGMITKILSEAVGSVVVEIKLLNYRYHDCSGCSESRTP